MQVYLNCDGVLADFDKRRHCPTNDVLIEDTLKHRHLWQEAGGTFIHHRSARQSLADLHALMPEFATTDPVAGRNPCNSVGLSPKEIFT